jgi:hypothetical protein
MNSFEAVARFEMATAEETCRRGETIILSKENLV